MVKLLWMRVEDFTATFMRYYNINTCKHVHLERRAKNTAIVTLLRILQWSRDFP